MPLLLPGEERCVLLLKPPRPTPDIVAPEYDELLLGGKPNELPTMQLQSSSCAIVDVVGAAVVVVVAVIADSSVVQ